MDGYPSASFHLFYHPVPRSGLGFPDCSGSVAGALYQVVDGPEAA